MGSFQRFPQFIEMLGAFFLYYFKILFMQDRIEASFCRTRAPARRDKRYRFPAVAARCDIPAAAAEVADRLPQKPTTNADYNKLHVRLDP